MTRTTTNNTTTMNLRRQSNSNWLALRVTTVVFLILTVWNPIPVLGQIERDVVSPTSTESPTTAAAEEDNSITGRADDVNGSTTSVVAVDDNDNNNNTNDNANDSNNDDTNNNDAQAEETAAEAFQQAEQYVQFNVQIDADTTDSFVVQVHPEWAPIGAARFLELVDIGFFDDNVRFFRVVENFMVQFGLSGDPAVTDKWNQDELVDDPVEGSNVKGTLSFATSGPNSRTTQIFLNFVDNTFLDSQGFAPFAEIASPEDMLVVERLYNGYGDSPPSGNGPRQGLISQQGNAYLEENFPLMSYITSAERIDAPTSASASGSSTTEGTTAPTDGGEATSDGESPVTITATDSDAEDTTTNDGGGDGGGDPETSANTNTESSATARKLLNSKVLLALVATLLLY